MIEQKTLRITQIVCQRLHFISGEIVLIPKDMIMSRPAGSLTGYKNVGVKNTFINASKLMRKDTRLHNSTIVKKHQGAFLDKET